MSPLGQWVPSFLSVSVSLIIILIYMTGFVSIVCKCATATCLACFVLTLKIVVEKCFTNLTVWLTQFIFLFMYDVNSLEEGISNAMAFASPFCFVEQMNREIRLFLLFPSHLYVYGPISTTAGLSPSSTSRGLVRLKK